jgi:predicted nuclease with TOPRIM domain
MKRILYLLIITIATSCIKKEQDLKDKLKTAIIPYVGSVLKDSCIVDSISVNKIDTITEKKRLMMAIGVRADYADRYIENAIKTNKLKRERLYLYDEIGLNNKILKSEAEKLLEELNQNEKEYKKMQDTINNLKEKVSKTDSTLLNVFGVEGVVHYTKTENNTSKTQPFYFFVNKDFKIIENKDFIKPQP